jgi:uncharacterized cupin superfamily protein
MAKKIDLGAAQTVVGTLYPPPYDEPCRPRVRQKLGDVAGLTQFGVNRLTLPPGAWSSQRHYHMKEDEFVYVLEGEVTLETDAGQELLRAGDSAGFKAGDTDGHCLKNLSDKPAVVLEVGTRAGSGDVVYYSGLDMMTSPTGAKYPYQHRDGTPYESNVRRTPETND